MRLIAEEKAKEGGGRQPFRPLPKRQINRFSITALPQEQNNREESIS